MQITKIKSPLINNLQQVQPSFKTQGIMADTVSFKSKLVMGKLPDDIKIDIENINENTHGVIDVNDTGYLAQIFKYRSSQNARTYAIKKVWPDHLAKHISANPVEQLKTEAEIYQRIKGVNNTPKFYYYSGDFSKSQNSEKNNYLVMEWVDGKQASAEGTFYNNKLITKGKLKKLFDLMQKFDQRGVLHNDLWAGNILFTKNGVNLIDFNRSAFFDPVKSPETNNLDSFKERFLSRYLSDVYEQSGEEALVDLYKTTQLFEADFLKKKSKFLKSNGLDCAAKKLSEQSKAIRQNLKNHDSTRENALNEVIKTDLRCGKIYGKYFEFEDGEALECYKRLEKTLPENPTVTSNIKVMSLLKEIMDLSYEHNTEDDFKKFKKIKQLLKDETVYPEDERKEVYYQKFSKFADVNMAILDKLLNGNNSEAAALLEENKDFFYQTKRMVPYYIKMSEIN